MNYIKIHDENNNQVLLSADNVLFVAISGHEHHRNRTYINYLRTKNEYVYVNESVEKIYMMLKSCDVKNKYLKLHDLSNDMVILNEDVMVIAYKEDNHTKIEFLLDKMYSVNVYESVDKIYEMLDDKEDRNKQTVIVTPGKPLKVASSLDVDKSPLTHTD